MKKIFFSMCSAAALALFACGGDNIDNLPLLGSTDNGSDGYYSSSSSDPSEGSYTVNNISDYKTTDINGQVWMAENLNYYVAGSKCYNNEVSYCAKYGRLYDWATAMGIDSYYNSNYYYSSSSSSKRQGICPNGWHLPSDDEWSALTSFVGSNAGTELKAASGWNDGGNGTDAYGFAALPGGNGGSDGYFSNAGNYGYWWSGSESNAYYAYYLYIRYYYGSVYGSSYDKSNFGSIRCVQD